MLIMATERPRRKVKSKNCDSHETGSECALTLTRRSQRSSMVERSAKKKKREVLVCEEDIVQQWLTLGTAKDLSSDADIARFLLSLYFNEKQKEAPSTDHCTRCHAPLVLRCSVCQLSFPHGRPPHLQLKSQTCAQPQDLPSVVPHSVTKDSVIPHSVMKDSVIPHSVAKDSVVPHSVTKEQSTTVLPVMKEGHQRKQYSFLASESACQRNLPSLSEGLLNTDGENLTENPTGSDIHSCGTEEREAVEKFNEGLSTCVPESSNSGTLNTVSSEKTGVALEGECQDGVHTRVFEECVRVSLGGVEILAQAGTYDGDEEHTDWDEVGDDGDNDNDDDDDDGKKRQLNSWSKVSGDEDVADDDDDDDDDGKERQQNSWSKISGDEDVGIDDDEDDCDDDDDKTRQEDSESNLSGRDTQYLCPYCPLVLKSSVHKPHIRTHTRTKDAFTCSTCSKTFTNFNVYYKHLKLSVDENQCRQCNHMFTSRCEVAKHSKQHEKTKARFCQTCDQSFPSMKKKDFDRHLNRHTKREKGESLGVALCPQCGKVFKRNDLKNHMTYHNKDDPFPCGVCDKAFKNKSCLRQHELFHREKTQQCEICGTKYFRKAGLDRHMQKHYGKQHTCGECARRFYSKTELQIHTQSVHQGICRYPCDFCNKKFYHQASLTIHLRTHTGEKPYHCDQCPSKFSRQEALRKHKWRHTGEKPFSCEDCGKVYSCQHSYKTHRKKHHSDSVYTCEDCYQVFPVRSSLDFHRKMCHDEKLLEISSVESVVQLKVESSALDCVNGSVGLK